MVGSVRLNPRVSSSFEDWEPRGPIYREAEGTPRRVFFLTTDSTPSILTLRSRSILTSLPLTARQQQAEALVEDAMDLATSPSGAAMIIGGGALLSSTRLVSIATELDLVSALSTSTLPSGFRWATSLAAAPAALFLGGCGESNYEPPTPTIPDPTPPPDYPDAGSPDSGTSPPPFLIERISIGSGSIQGNGHSNQNAITHDGRLVAFTSHASNLLANDTNNGSDIFLRDRSNGNLERVSLGFGDSQFTHSSYAPVITPDGRFVAFENFQNIFVRDRMTHNTQQVNLNLSDFGTYVYSSSPSISGDGSFIVFHSYKPSLEGSDVFFRNTTAGITNLVSVTPMGEHGNEASFSPFISSNGRFVGFSSYATNLSPEGSPGSDVFLRDLVSGENYFIGANSTGERPSLSSDGRFVAFSAGNFGFPGDTNDRYDIFVRDIQTGNIERVSVGSGGIQGNGHSFEVSISSDGRYVAFSSEASNLVPDDTNGVEDIFVHDRTTGITRRVSVGVSEIEANGASRAPSISGDGHYVVFTSGASNLVGGDTNGFFDIFLVGLDYFFSN